MKSNMKRSILKITSLFLLVTFMGTSCEKDPKSEFSDYVDGYITGSFSCDETDRETGVATGKKTERGYCILLEGSKNKDSHWPMDFYTFDLPPKLFDFPEEITSATHNGSDCGPVFFSDNLKTKYKIRFLYRESTSAEKVGFACGPCTFMHLTFNWDNFKQMTLKEVAKIDDP